MWIEIKRPILSFLKKAFFVKQVAAMKQELLQEFHIINV